MKMGKVNKLTIVGRNSALHFAMLNLNVYAIRLICKAEGANLSLKNSLGWTPMDIARMLPSKRLRFKIMQYLSQKMSKNHSPRKHQEFAD